MCYNNSFASHPLKIYWSTKNKLLPREVRIYSNKKYWFTCSNKHEFNSALNNITGQLRNWCPYCKNKTEDKLFNFLKKYYSDVVSQYKVQWCKNPKTERFLPFDFAILSKKVIIELDGEQHFSQIAKWKPPHEVQERDKYKMNVALKNS